jgi:hypothetical protein
MAPDQGARAAGRRRVPVAVGLQLDGTAGSDGGSTSAIVWILIAAAGLAVIGMAGSTLRKRSQ